MTRLLLFLFTLSISLAYGQQKKLIKLLGDDFQRVSARTNNPYMETSEACKIVPSISIVGDTSGLVYQNEYMLFRNYPDTESFANAVLSCTKTTFVSNAEYLEFQNWVRDSIARENIYTGLEDNQDAIQFLKISKSVMRKNNVDDSNRSGNRARYSLNWDKKFSYTDMEFVPLLASMYLPQSDQFYQNKAIDERYLRYVYTQSIREDNPGFNEIDFNIPVILFQDFWATKSASINDEYSVLGQVYDQVQPAGPAVGLTGAQANAFCHWKEIQLQQQVNEKHLPYLVHVTLPLVSELNGNTPTGLNVPAKEYTENWKITVSDYRLFMQAVRDSFFIEVLYAELPDSKEATKFIQAKPLYFDEGGLEFAAFDPEDRSMNRELFPLTENSSILKKYKNEIKRIDFKNRLDSTIYKYYRVDVKSKTIVGKSRKNLEHVADGRTVEVLYPSEKDSITKYPIGMDMNLDSPNRLLHGSGVRSHSRYNRFIIREVVQITPNIPIENQNSEDFVQGISYEQALAYYHWKYPISKIRSTDDWQNYIYPDEEQFAQIQAGKQIVIPEHSVAFPSPTFRYTVTFIPVTKPNER